MSNDKFTTLMILESINWAKVGRWIAKQFYNCLLCMPFWNDSLLFTQPVHAPPCLHSTSYTLVVVHTLFSTASSRSTLFALYLALTACCSTQPHLFTLHPLTPPPLPTPHRSYDSKVDPPSILVKFSTMEWSLQLGPHYTKHSLYQLRNCWTNSSPQQGSPCSSTGNHLRC